MFELVLTLTKQLVLTLTKQLVLTSSQAMPMQAQHTAFRTCHVSSVRLNPGVMGCSFQKSGARLYEYVNPSS
jgi:hypothetical protein